MIIAERKIPVKVFIAIRGVICYFDAGNFSLMLTDKTARIADKSERNGFVTLNIESPRLAPLCRPGQFVMVRILPQPYPLLRRPFSVHSRDGNFMSIFFRVTGEGTALLAQKTSGESMDIVGPLGRGFFLERDFRDKPAYVVGGGRGIAPLYFLSLELKKKGVGVRVFYGGKDKDELPLLNKFSEGKFDTECSTDDGSYGYHGPVTDLLPPAFQRETPACLYACGPDPMMKILYGMAEKRHVPSEFSLESVMACGIGACWGCVKRVQKEGSGQWVKICDEGPVFSGKEVIWDEND